MMPKDSKIYIAGHTGLVGKAIVRKMQAEGYTQLILRDINQLDLLDQAKTIEFFSQEKPEYVIDAAARVGGIKANMTWPAEFLYENLQIQNNIIWSAFKFGVKKLLFLGTACIYPKDSLQPIKEEYLLDGKPEPTNDGYSIAKIAGIKLCEKIYSEYDRKFISCMPTNIYGPGDNFDPETSHVIPSLMRKMHEAKLVNLPEISIWGSGQSRREFLHVDDLADAIVWLMNNYDNKEFLNVGTGRDISIKELAELMKKVVGYEGNLVFDTSKPDGMLKRLLEVSKMTNLGWQAKIDFETGLREMYQSFLKSV